MSAMELMVSAAILVLGFATLGSAQRRHRGPGYNHQHYYPQQQQQQHYQNQYQYPEGQAGVSVSGAEWVCKNPKTGDMMIIVSENVPAGQGHQWQQQPPSTGQPAQPTYPSYPQQPTNYPQSEPTYPQTQPSYSETPAYPTQPPTAPTYPTTQQPIQLDTSPANTGGEGIIDIRFGEDK